ncbi:hypothetical protein NIES2101_23280 [Calothrix sp. HK-06]|nr:hypothetical protein NIES2101_23280 [Calothrix sp. HK-06]
MEFTVMQIIDIVLYFLIYGGACFIILAILLDLQTAWINHTSSNINASIVSNLEECVSTIEIPTSPVTDIDFKESVEIELNEVAVAPIQNEVAVPIPTPVLVAKDSFPISKSSKSASKIRIEELRQQCENAKIQWRYARINPATNRKRHLTEDEMLTELGI